MIGTPLWMSPELIESGAYGASTDVWSLGITALEMAEMAPPHHDVNPTIRALFLITAQPAPTLRDPAAWTDDFGAFIGRCLQKDIGGRADSTELLDHPFVARGVSLGMAPVLTMIERATQAAAAGGGARDGDGESDGTVDMMAGTRGGGRRSNGTLDSSTLGWAKAMPLHHTAHAAEEVADAAAEAGATLTAAAAAEAAAALNGAAAATAPADGYTAAATMLPSRSPPPPPPPPLRRARRRTADAPNYGATALASEPERLSLDCGHSTRRPSAGDAAVADGAARAAAAARACRPGGGDHERGGAAASEKPPSPSRRRRAARRRRSARRSDSDSFTSRRQRRSVAA